MMLLVRLVLVLSLPASHLAYPIAAASPTPACRKALSGCWPVKANRAKCTACEATQQQHLHDAGCTSQDILLYCEPPAPDPPLPMYPVYWNVNGWSGNVAEGSPQLPVAISRFGFIDPNRTETGGGCSVAGCSGCNHSLDCEPYPCPKKYWRGCWQGDMPEIHPDGTLKNGGVPQAANLSRHLDLLRRGMPKWIPDPNWSGNAMLDFESWVPLYSENSGSSCGYHGACYQELSIKLVKQAHPDWPQQKIAQEAESQFNKAALDFFVQTLQTCRALRPKARWGYYGYFYGVPYPRALYEAMSMFNPQLYMYGDASTSSSAVHQQRREEVAAIVRSAVNISRQLEADGLPRPLVLPVGWQYYPSRVSTLDASDLASELLSPYNSGADGLILWGDDPENAKYRDFVANTTGPSVSMLPLCAPSSS